MARWEPDARGRLEKSALELFQERGYARTTVEEIAAHAGLTERTFFRHFADKREVLFASAKELETTLSDTIAQAHAEAAPLDVVLDAFAAAGALLQSRRDLAHVRARHALVREHSDLRERELIKRASLAAVVSEALRARGVGEPAASMAAEAGVAAFKIGFERWIGGKRPADLAAQIRAAMQALRGIIIDTGDSAPARGTSRAPTQRRPK